MAAIALVLGLTVILSVFVLNLSRSAQSDSGSGLIRQLPVRLGSLLRVQVMEGEEALSALGELHRGTVGVTWAAMAHYEKGRAQAMVWVGGVETAQFAQELVARMTSGLQRGGTPFVGLRTLVLGGRTVFSVSGLGQTHYYFTSDRTVIWVSADPEAEEEILEAVLQAVGRGEAR